MAIFYKTGTLNPASTTLSNDIRLAWISAINDAIAAGYTKYSVVDHDYSVGTSKRSVINHTDGWSAMLINTNTTGNSSLDIFSYFGQSYTLATHTLNNIAFGGNTLTPTANSTGFSGVNYSPTTIPARGTTPQPQTSNYGVVANASQTTWTAFIEQDYAYFSFNGNVTYKGDYLFIGKFQTMVANTALTDTYPFGMLSSQQSIIGTASFSILQSLNNQSKTIAHAGGLFSFPYDGEPAKLGSYDKYSSQPNRAKLSPVYIFRKHLASFTSGVQPFPPSDSSTNGWLRGKLPKAYHGDATNANYGDTVSISGVTYQFIGGTSWHNNNSVELNTALWIEVA